MLSTTGVVIDAAILSSCKSYGRKLQLDENTGMHHAFSAQHTRRYAHGTSPALIAFGCGALTRLQIESLFLVTISFTGPRLRVPRMGTNSIPPAPLPVGMSSVHVQ